MAVAQSICLFPKAGKYVKLILTQIMQQAWMKHGKILDAENLQDEFGTLFDVSDSSSSCSAPMDCHYSTRPIAFSGFNT